MSFIFANGVSLGSCRTTKVVDGSVFEESLSVDEYPDIELLIADFDSSLQIGSSRYRAPELVSVEALPAVGFDQNFRIKVEQEGKNHVIILFAGSDGNGILEVNNKLVATLSCLIP